MKKNLSKIVLLCILTGRNGCSCDFLSEDVRPKKKPQRIIEPSGRTWCERVCVYWRTSCVYACTYVCMCVCVYAHMHVCMCVHMCARSCTCVHVCVLVCTCSCAYAYAHACMHGVCACVRCARDVCARVRACPWQAGKKLKSWGKSTEMVHPHVVLNSFPLLTVHVKLYILPPTPEYATNFLTLLYEKYEAKNKGVEEAESSKFDLKEA